MVLLGVGEIFGGQALGYIRDNSSNKASIVVYLIFCIISFTLTFLFNDKNEFNYLAYLMCFVWGFQDSGLNCLVRCVLGFEFESKITPFCVFNFVQSFFIFVF